VLCADDPERLPTALDAVADGWTTVDRRAVEIAGEAPRLDARRSYVLQQILRGSTNQQLATRTTQSVSTVKRDIAELFEAFGASSRLELAANARALGFRAEPG
jgi:DNA-binding NarL/FixJ family response regulator